MKRSSFIIILLTILLDIIGLGIIIPSMPFIIRNFGLGEHWVGITFATFSLGMFLGWMVFGRLSDIYGRKKMLAVTSCLNMIGYFTFAYSGNIWVFLVARFLSGVGWAGMAVGQAYVSDISEPKDRTKNLGLTGTMLGFGFILGPVLGGIFWEGALTQLGFISGTIIFLNFLLIVFFLPEIQKKHLEAKNESVIPFDFQKHKRQIYFLFATTLVTGLGFSAMQATFALVLADRFSFDARLVGYSLWFIGVIAVIYQALLIKRVQFYLSEKGMIIFGLLVLAVSFAIFAFNPYLLGIIIIAGFPIGYGSVNPAVGSLHAHYAGHEAGKALGTNSSMLALGNIAWPFIAGYLYNYWHGAAPYVFSSILFSVTSIGVWYGLNHVARN